MELTIVINGTKTIEAYIKTPPRNLNKFLLGKAGRYCFKFTDMSIPNEPQDEITDIFVVIKSPPAIICVDYITVNFGKNRIIARIDKKEATK